MDNTTNRIILCGELASMPEYSHENHGKAFYRFALDVERLSGTVDTLQILAASSVLDSIDLSGGTMLRIDGQIRSFNNRSTVGRKLLISVFAQAITACDDPAENQAEVTGTLCREPVFRQTPLGRDICDIMLAVPRLYRRTDYLPCILWGRTARDAAEFPVGTTLHVAGRLQSRQYIKILDSGSEKRIAYELSAMDAIPLTPEVSE
ncbi:MAG: single-stranded DNA-binding protein [Clostridia bacterium]|nr:single-stranded DNA-binding protein [Clostridia bacterium]